jgi:hypothetical protein
MDNEKIKELLEQSEKYSPLKDMSDGCSQYEAAMKILITLLFDYKIIIQLLQAENGKMMDALQDIEKH